MRYLVLILLFPLALSAQTAAAGRGTPQPGANGANTAPPPPPPTPTADLAGMEGQVFNAPSGTPLRKATINLNRQNSGPLAAGARGNYSATSDASGHYSITGIEPGTYRINVSHTGFLSMQYNARRPEGPGTALDLARAQKMTGVDFRLTPHGVVTGKVTDEDGDPLENVQIQIMRLVYNQGRKQLQQNGGASTNDLGEYRLSGIIPGKYYLSAIYRGRRQFDMANGEAPQEDYVTTFYPGVTDMAAASTVEMTPGDQLPGVNFRLNKTHTVKVTGHVADNTSPAPPPVPDAGRGAIATVINAQINVAANGRIQLRLQPRNSLNPNGLNVNTAVRADGNFEFASVAPGSYYLIAVNNQGGRNGAHVSRQALDVGDNNVEGVNIAINPGADVTGQVRYDGDPPQPLPSLTVRLSPRENNLGIPQPQPAKVEANGSFHFDDISLDVYNVNVNVPQGLYLKSLRSGNNDVMVSGLDLGNGSASLDVLLGVNPPQVGGSVVLADTGQPAVAVTVVLMPREKERQDQGYFYSTSNSDQYGNFTFNRVTPGDYQVYAWEDVEYGQWFDPEWMKPYLGKGESLTQGRQPGERQIDHDSGEVIPHILCDTQRLVLNGNLGELARLTAEIEQFCGRHELPTDVEFDLVLVLEELFVNSIKHGGCQNEDGAAEIGLTVVADGIVLEYADRGTPFDPTQAPTTDLAAPLAERLAGGLGIHLMRQIMRDFEYQWVDGWNRIRMRRPIPAEGT